MKDSTEISIIFVTATSGNIPVQGYCRLLSALQKAPFDDTVKR